MKAACYLRCSTGDQHTDNQVPDIMDYCKAHWWPEPEIYRENESAWRKGHQAELSRLLADIRSGRRKYDRLIIWSLDRLSRGGVGELFGLIHAFRQYGCQVVSCKEPWLESAGPAGDLLLAVTAWIAEFESLRRSERTLAGLARAKKEGKTLGRPSGSKDKEPRHRTGYLLRYAKK
jgi:DNA invertase Pin-like site-specific DNA recombinase